MSNTPRLTMPYMPQNPGSGELIHNMALAVIDAMCQCTVINRTTTAPPSVPADGDTYIIGASATGAWTGKDNQIATFYSGWTYIVPLGGWRAYDQGANEEVFFDGSAWGVFGSGGGTVASVALAMPSGFSVAGSPITTSGTFTVTLSSQAANKFLGSPSGGAGAPTFRVLVAADIPAIDHGAGLSGLADDDHTQYIIKTGATLARNTIVGNDINAQCLMVKQGTGGSLATANIFEVQDSGGTPILSVLKDSSAGRLIVASATILSGLASGVQLYDAGSTNYVWLKPPASVPANWTLTLPTTAGTVGYILTTNGSGVTSWVNALPALNLGSGAAPSSYLTLAAGTATAGTAPLRFTTGTNLTTPVSGAVEFDGNIVTYTPAAAVRLSFTGAMFVQTATVTIANTAAETTGVGSGVGTVTLPANLLKVGKTLRTTAMGVMSFTGSVTLNVTLKYGSVVLDTGGVAPALGGSGVTNMTWEYRALSTCRTTGASGTIQTQGIFLYGSSGTAIQGFGKNDTTTVTVDTTTSNALSLTFTWSVADPGNTISITNLMFEWIF